MASKRSSEETKRLKKDALTRDKKFKASNYHEQIKRISEDAQILPNNFLKTKSKFRSKPKIGSFDDIFLAAYNSIIYCLNVEKEISGTLGHLDIETRAKIETEITSLTPKLEFFLENFLLINDERKRLMNGGSGFFINSKKNQKNKPENSSSPTETIEKTSKKFSDLNQRFLIVSSELERLKDEHRQILIVNSDLIKEEGNLRNEVLDFKRVNGNLEAKISQVTFQAEKNISELVKQSSLAERYLTELEENRKSHKSRKAQVIGLTSELVRLKKKSSSQITSLSDTIIEMDAELKLKTNTSNLEPSDLSTRNSNLEVQFQKVLTKNLNLKRDLEKVEENNQYLERLRLGFIGQLEITVNQLLESQSQVESLEVKLNKKSSSNEERKKQISNLKKTFYRLKSNLDFKTSQLKEMGVDYQLIEAENLLSHRKLLISKLNLVKESKKVSTLESTLEKTNSSLNSVNMDLDSLRSENCDYLVQVSSLTSDLELESKKVSSLTSQILILEQSLSDSSSLSNSKKQDLELELSNLNYVLKASNSKISSLNLDLETCKSVVLTYTSKLSELELIEDGLISSSQMLSEKLGIESKKVSDLESSNFKLSDLLDSSRSDFDRSLSRSDYLESLSKNLGFGLSWQKNLTSNLSDELESSQELNSKLKTEISNLEEKMKIESEINLEDNLILPKSNNLKEVIYSASKKTMNFSLKSIFVGTLISASLLLGSELSYSVSHDFTLSPKFSNLVQTGNLPNYLTKTLKINK